MNCKPGYHLVNKHTRISKNGRKHIVDEHCRSNPSSKAKFLYKSNLDYIFDKYKSNFKYKKLNRVKGFPQDKGQYDVKIQFWLNYWKDKKLIDENIDPLLVKSIIAVESTFREKVITKMPNSSATGLMQILVSTMLILSQKKEKEIRKGIIDISQNEAKEANTNIAAGTRWLIYKITTSPWRNKKSKKERMFGGVKYYHSWNLGGEKYAEKVFRVYNNSK